MPAAFKYVYIFILISGIALFILGFFVDPYGILSFLLVPGYIVLGVMVTAAVQAIFFGFGESGPQSKPKRSKWVVILAVATLAIYAAVLATS